MKHTYATTAALALLGALLLPTQTPANTAESLLAGDGNGTSSINGTTNWSPATSVAPTNVLAATYDYTAAATLRTPSGAANYAVLANSLTLNSGGSLIFKGYGTNTVNNLILNGGQLTQSGTGVPAGIPDTAWLAGSINLAANTTMTTSTSGGTNQSLTILAPITNAASALLTVDGASTALGSGALVLAAQNTFKGNILVINRTPGVILRLGVDNALPNTTLLTLNGGTNSSPVFDLNGHSTTISNLTLTTGTTMGIITNSAANTTGTLALGYNDASETLSIGTITDNPGANSVLALTKVGNGTLTLGAAYTYSGDTTVNAGTLKMGNSNILPNGAGKGNLVLNAGGKLNLSGRSETINGLSGSGAIDNSTGTSTYTLSVGNNDVTSTFSGAIANASGTVALTKLGAGALYLTGNSTFAGNVKISTGAVWFATSSALGTGAKTVTIQKNTGGASSELHLNGTNGDLSLPSGLSFFTGNSTANGAIVNEAGDNTISGPVSLSTGGSTLVTVNGGSLTLAGNINIAAAQTSRSLTISGAANGTVSGVITNGDSGLLSLTKTGLGTWTLAGANVYSDVTTISGGTLALSGGGSINNTPGISVASGAVFDVSAVFYALGNSQDLSGKGTVAGSGSTAVTLSGTIHPGGIATVGTLAFTGAGGLSLGGTANTTFDLGNLPGTVGGTANDLITVSGPLTLGGTLTINSSTLVAGTYTLFTCSGTPSGSTAVIFTGGSAPGGYTLNLVPGAVTLTVSFTTPTSTGLVALPPNGWVYGLPVTFTATVSPAPPNGEPVNFYDGATLIGSVTLSSGQASYTTTPGTQLAVGSRSITAAYAGDGLYLGSTSSAMTESLAQKPVVPSVTVSDKTYDGTNSATITIRTLSGVIGAEDASLGTSGIAVFADAGVGTNRTVNITGLSLSGTNAGNYTLSTTATNATATISPAGVTVSGVTADNKVYDQTAVAMLSTTGATLAGVIPPDVVSLDANVYAATFASTNAATNIAVTVTGLTLSGAQKDNYTLAQPTDLAADITPKGLTVSGLAANDKTYDTTDTAGLTGTGSLDGVISPDAVSLEGTSSAAFADGAAGSNKTVTVTGYSLGGADATNYALVSPSLAASITPAALTVAADSNSKPYGSTLTFAGTEFLTSGLLGEDSVTSVTLTSAGASAAAIAGNYDIVPSDAVGTGLTNYTITSQNGTLTVLLPPQPLIQPVTASSTNLLIQFSAEAGYSYFLESSPSLEAPVWTLIATTNSSGGTISLQVPIDQSYQFFRVGAGNP